MKVTVIAAGFERRRSGRTASTRPSASRSYSGFEEEGDDVLDIPTFVQG
jgi:hypothetical protein